MFVAASAKRLWSAFRRVFPRCNTIAQAAAFNLFFAFFPALLIAVGFATTPIGGKTGLFPLITDFTRFLPPGSQQILSDFLAQRSPGAWKVIAVGWSAAIFGGTLVMKLLVEGIHQIYQEPDTARFLRRQFRAAALLLVTFAPLVGAAVLGVLGRPLRLWLGRELGIRAHTHALWTVLFPAIAIVLGMAALTIIYRVARAKEETWRHVMPGAVVATLLWWCVNALFGFYVRRFPYGAVYRGLAAVIGLLIWMELSVMIVFIGAAWNAAGRGERAEQRPGERIGAEARSR
jgi:membrane protein